MDKKTKILLTCALILAGLGILFVAQSLNFGKLRLIFCDVGQGDGMLIISPGGNQVVVDGGPGAKIDDCLSRNMPFWDRTIELVVLTHPQADHMMGLLTVLGKYKVRRIATTDVPAATQTFTKWQGAMAKSGAQIYNPEIGDSVLLDPKRGDTSPRLAVLWPARSQVLAWRDPPTGSPKVDLNETAIVAKLIYGQFCAYLSADIPKEILQGLIDRSCPVLKIAHHGSRTGTSELVLEQAKPELAIIQSGQNNRYGHPHKEIIDLLVSKGVKILRNDTNGIIEITSDGRSYKVKSER